MYDFDKIIDTTGTHRMKYSNPPEGAPADTIPMWIADMDFQTLPEMIEALKKRADHGIFGYTYLPDCYREAVAGWMERRHNWKIDPKWITATPGIIPSLKAAVCLLTEPGDGVLVQPPVYYMFMEIIRVTGRTVVENPLLETADGYKMDLEDFEKKIVEKNIKMFILCSPHNPVSRVWTRDELKQVGEICKKHNVTIVSDEIHHDFVYEGNEFVSFTAVDPSFKDIAITCTAPSKTFNCAGLKTANIIIGNEELRAKYGKQLKQFGLTGINALSVPAIEAAYTYGDQWVDEVVSYIYENFQIVDRFLKEKLPKIKLRKPECLYLAWIDLREQGIEDEEFYKVCLQSGVWLEAGREFGDHGKGFARLNLACPHTTVEKALNRIYEGVKRWEAEKEASL